MKKKSRLEIGEAVMILKFIITMIIRLPVSLLSAILDLFPKHIQRPIRHGFFLRSPKPPVELPFAVQQAGTIMTTELRIVEYRTYFFNIDMYFKPNDQEERKRIQKLVGEYGRDQNGNLYNPGIAIPLRLTVSVLDAAGEHPLFDRNIEYEEVYAWGADHFTKNIGQIELRPGRYRATIESLKDIPELVGTPVTFSITYRIKSTPH